MLETTAYQLNYMPVIDLIWGKGFISPGGNGNVDKIVEGVDLQGKRVLELGSGGGAGALRLVVKYGAEVVGLDLEEPLVELSRRRADEAGLIDKVEFQCVEPGPFAFEDESFDVFYTSGVICHIEDRLSLFREVLRILKPGGMLLGYDWFPTVMSVDIIRWLKAARLNLFPDSPERYANIMGEAGFQNITHHDATRWYRNRCAEELEQLMGPLFDEAAELSSPEIRNSLISEWHMANIVLRSGDLRTGYFRGRKLKVQ